LPDGGGVTRTFTRFTLGDDLAQGRHLVEVAYESDSQRGATWVRFWTPGHRARRERVSMWMTEDAPQ